MESSPEISDLHMRIIQNTIDKCSKFHNPRILDAVKQHWIERLKYRESCDPDQLKPVKRQLETEDTFSDDEFVDAEVKSIAVDSAPSKDSELSNESLSDISDLDDNEPETDDIIIGLLDKVTRPNKKTVGTSTWRLVMNGGILRVNGKEISFGRLEGSFEFV